VAKKKVRRPSELTKLFRKVLLELAIDLNQGDLVNTPARMASTWLELTRSMEIKPPKIKTFKAEGVQILGIHGLHYFALCEHHGLPFEGSVCVMYVPGKRLIGLSKPARLVAYYSHLMMIQERFTHQLLEAIITGVKPQAAYVVARGRHLCSAMRGVESREHEFITEEMKFADARAKILWESRLYRAELLCKGVR